METKTRTAWNKDEKKIDTTDKIKSSRSILDNTKVM